MGSNDPLCLPRRTVYRGWEGGASPPKLTLPCAKTDEDCAEVTPLLTLPQLRRTRFWEFRCRHPPLPPDQGLPPPSELVFLTILYALLVRAFVRVLAAAFSAGEQRNSSQQHCKLRVAALSCAEPQLLGQASPAAVAAVPRAGVGGSRALRRFKGRGVAWVRWT